MESTNLITKMSSSMQLVGKGDIASMKYDRNSDLRQKEMMKMLESAQEVEKVISKISMSQSNPLGVSKFCFQTGRTYFS
jgi:hypothetical protein